jgi:hypothetical protein
MPRNDERLGASEVANSANHIPQEEVKGILDFVLPTEFVDLPTKGKFYPEGHPLHNEESVEIRYMTAKDTDILTSKSLLKKGLAVDRMIQNILINKEIKVDDLYIGDKNAILVAARINGFGSNYETKVTCPACGTSANHTFDLNDLSENAEEESEYEISQNGTFSIELPISKQTVECRLLSGKDEKVIFNRNEKRKKKNLPETSLTDQYKMFVVSVSGVTERGLVEKFIDVMPARDSNHLKSVYNKVSPNIDLSYDFSCNECDSETSIDVPFSANFFWPG